MLRVPTPLQGVPEPLGEGAGAHGGHAAHRPQRAVHGRPHEGGARQGTPGRALASANPGGDLEEGPELKRASSLQLPTTLRNT